jgi:catalase
VIRTRNPKGGNTVETLLRVSTVADGERDFALKGHAGEGNWDLVGINAQES